jgi:hypothetical protein
MTTKPTTRTRRPKVTLTPDDRDFARLDAWARKLTLADGRPLTVAERQDEHVARSVGRPAKAGSAKAKPSHD